MSETPTTADQHQTANESEYGTWVATAVIEVGRARAFNPGDPVPASHVSRGVVREDQVARVTTKAGRAATGVDTKKG